MTAQQRLPLVIDHGQNMLSVLIDGKYVAIECRTLYQVEQYSAMMERNKAKGTDEIEAKPETTAAILLRNFEVHLDFLEIALNPKPGKVDFPRPILREKFSLDQAQIVADIWLDRFLRPRIDRDPALAPPPGVR